MVQHHLDWKIRIIWLLPIILFILLAWLILSAGAVAVLGKSDIPASTVIIGVLAMLILSFGIPSFAWIELTYRAFTYELTPVSLKIIQGILTRHRSVIPYDKIEDITAKRTPVERIMGLATLKVETSGTDPSIQSVTLPGISNYEELIPLILSKAGDMRREEAAGQQNEKRVGDEVLPLVLHELKAIRHLLEKEREEREKRAEFSNLHEIPGPVETGWEGKVKKFFPRRKRKKKKG